jgi:hypothetical protein
LHKAVEKRSKVMFAEVLTVHVQYGKPYIWAVVDPSKTEEYRQFKCVGTGHQMKLKPGRYIGTFQIQDGALVFHVFETVCLLRKP